MKVTTAAFRLTEALPEIRGMKLSLENGKFTMALAYDHDRERPLPLRAAAAVGDEIRLRILPARLELWVNDVLADEEWPWGDLQADLTDPFLTVTESEETEPELPSVISTFTNAEGWLPGGGVFVGDCMPYTNGGRYHVLYLKDRHHHGSKWDRGAHQWEHISTADFREWQIHPMAVSIDEKWEASICTGSFIEAEGRYWLYYTVRTTDGSPAPIKRSVSEDGYHFRKDEGFGFTLSARYNAASARDPKVFRTADGIYHMFLTTTLLSAERGCLAHLTSKDGEVWTETEPVYISDDRKEPECSDCFEVGGFRYLVFSLGGKGQYRYSRGDLENWMMPENPLIPCSSVPKAAIWDGKAVFTGFRSEWGYAGVMTFRTAVPKENGELTF